jgi:plasmid replication initiation protein
MEEKNLVVVKHNSLIEASYRLTLGEQRLLLACISQVDSTDSLVKKDEFTITAKQFSTLFDIPQCHAYEQIEKAANDLFEQKIVIKSKTEKRKKVMRWVCEVDYDGGKGQVTLGFSPKIIPYLSQLKDNYTKYRLEHISQLKSVHTIRIYELCVQYMTIGHRTITVKDLKELIGISGLYSDFKDLTRRVLKPSLDQINKHTDIRIKITPQREMRKIVALKFEMEYKKATRPVKVSNQRINKELKHISEQLDLLH